MRRLIALAAGVVVLGFLCASLTGYLLRWGGWQKIHIDGVVLRDDTDPRKQVAIPNAEVTATNGRSEVTQRTDNDGHFDLAIRPGFAPRQTIKLLVRHPQYRPLELNRVTGSEIYLARLEPMGAEDASAGNTKPVLIGDVRVRYSEKRSAEVNVGNAAKSFEVPGEANVPCDGRSPCSPGGKWKAMSYSQTFEAGQGHQFHNARLVCIAGPCPYTKVQTSGLTEASSSIKVDALNWSDTTTFLLEADVTEIITSNVITQSYPAIFGPAMNFTLASGAEGPSIEANLNGLDIVFPLGPRMQLPWADCTVQVSPTDQSKQFRCELKPGYRFR